MHPIFPESCPSPGDWLPLFSVGVISARQVGGGLALAPVIPDVTPECRADSALCASHLRPVHSRHASGWEVGVHVSWLAKGAHKVWLTGTACARHA
jgi:hypothetical protein